MTLYSGVRMNFICFTQYFFIIVLTFSSAVPDGTNGEKLVLRLKTDACKGQKNEVRYLEHTQAIITLNSTRRGDVTIKLTSPMGTKSLLLSSRVHDADRKDGFQRWPFMTTHTWGEDPEGEWVLEVAMADGSPNTAFVSEWTLVLHGTQVAPYIDEARSKPKCERAVEKTKQMEEEMQQAEPEPEEETFADYMEALNDAFAPNDDAIDGGPEDTNLEDWYTNDIQDQYENQQEYDENADDWYREQLYKYKLQQLRKRLSDELEYY